MSEYNYHPVVCFGETLWDMLPSGKQAGGAPMNVAYHLQKLGKNPAVISKIGNDALGKELINLLSNRGICTGYFQVDYIHPTSVVDAVAKNALEMTYTIKEDVAWDYIELQAELIYLVQQADYFVFGSLATRSAQTYITLKQLLRCAKKKVFDVNLRPPFYDQAVIEEFLHEADIVKLNADELHLISGWYSSIKDETECIRILKQRFQIETLIVTKGANGAILNRGNEWSHCNGLSVIVADTVGSGDAFLAAVISKLADGAGTEEILHYANQLAAFIATQKGACPEYQLSDLTYLTTGAERTTSITRKDKNFIA